MCVNLMGVANDLGYGRAGIGLLQGLSEVYYHTPPAFFNVASEFGKTDISVEPEYHDIVVNAKERALMLSPTAPCVRVWHPNEMSYRVGKGVFFGFPIFELDKFTAQETHHLSIPDAIIATSQWGVDVLRENGVNKVLSPVPLGVDTEFFSPLGERYWPFAKFVDENTFIILNAGKWEIRKGHDKLPQIVRQALPGDENFLLVMCSDNPFLSRQEKDDWENMYRGILGDKVVFLHPRIPHQKQLASLFRCADVGLFPYRAEGWNMELLEMMALGKPVVATNYSAPTEYLTNENSRTVTPSEKELAFDGRWFFNQGKWAAITKKEISSFSDVLRWYYEEKKSGKPLNNPAGIETARRLSWRNSAQKLAEAINGFL